SRPACGRCTGQAEPVRFGPVSCSGYALCSAERRAVRSRHHPSKPVPLPLVSPITLTDHQEAALDSLLAFLDGPPGAFVLTGSAGTGKTTLLHTLCESMEDEDRRVQLLAP